MAAATLRRMRSAQQAKLRPRPAIQVPGGLALPLVLALLLASSGKWGVAVGRSREDGEGPGAERQDGPDQGTGASECPEQVAMSRGAGSLQPRRGRVGCRKGSMEVGSPRGLRSEVESCRDPGSERVDGRGGRSGGGV